MSDERSVLTIIGELLFCASLLLLLIIGAQVLGVS